MRHLKLAAYIAGPNAVGGHRNNLVTNVIRQRAAVYEEAAKLVHTALALVILIGAIVVGQEGPEVAGKRRDY